MEFVLDRLGDLRDPDLHDGYVDGIRLPDDKTVLVSLRDVRGLTFTMQLVGVERFVCNDFREGNIIMSVWIVSGMAPDKGVLDTLFPPYDPSVDQKFHDQYARLLKLHTKQIREGERVPVTIDPSYGCTLTAFCREVLIFRD